MEGIDRIVYEQQYFMEKTPLKKIKMMDIVRKTRPERAEGRPQEVVSRAEGRPNSAPIVRKESTTLAETSSGLKAASAQGFGEPKEEQVKFTIEKKPVARQVQESIDEREAKREQEEEVHTEAVKEVVLPYRPAEPIGIIEPRIELRPTAEEIQAALHEQQPKEEVHHPEPHRLEMHIPEVSPMEIDKPIAYIPKEKTSREEKKVLERIERRERYYEKEEKNPKKKRGIFTWIVSCLLLGVGAYLVVAVLPRVEISLVAKTYPFDWSNPIVGNTKIAEIDPIGRQIPVAVFPGKKTNAFQFPATGAGKSIERKATGKVTVYNDFSGSQQPLLAGTRLETPDGKIFKLKDRIIVPGATTSGGKLVAASIDADVIADKAGEAYNISPVSKLTIPGFKGTTKYDGFYAESKDPMTGGFVGVGKYPTADDIKTGKENAEKQIKAVIEAGLVVGGDIPEGFKVIDGSKKFTITKEVVNEGVDDQGNFSIYIEAEEPTAALKEDHVLKLMTALAQQAANKGEGYEMKSHTLTYGAITIDEKSGAISLPIEFKGVFWDPINLDEFKRNVVGKKEDDLKAYIFSSTNIDKADVALWPFWVKTVPNDLQRVKVELK